MFSVDSAGRSIAWMQVFTGSSLVQRCKLAMAYGNTLIAVVSLVSASDLSLLPKLPILYSVTL